MFFLFLLPRFFFCFSVGQDNRLCAILIIAPVIDGWEICMENQGQIEVDKLSDIVSVSTLANGEN